MLVFVFLLSSCSGIINQCGEYGECSRDIEDTVDYVEGLSDVLSVDVSTCLSGLDSTDRDGIEKYDLEEDQSGICLLLIQFDDHTIQLHSFGSKNNTKVLDEDVAHDTQEIMSILDQHDIDYRYIGFTIGVEDDDIIYISVDDLYFNFLNEDLEICDYAESENCMLVDDYFSQSD